MRAFLPALPLLALLATWARADFDAGLAAYDGGRFAEAAAAWHRLADEGEGRAQLALAGLYRQGLGVRAVAARAAHYYALAAAQGFVGAQVNIGEMRERGEGVARDPARAWAWYRRAAEAGNA